MAAFSSPMCRRIIDLAAFTSPMRRRIIDLAASTSPRCRSRRGRIMDLAASTSPMCRRSNAVRGGGLELQRGKAKDQTGKFHQLQRTGIASCVLMGARPR
jgi:hypothetical protein